MEAVEVEAVKVEAVKVEADHIPPKCVFKNLQKHLEEEKYWWNKHKDDHLRKSIGVSLDETIEKIMKHQNIEVNDEMFKNVIVKLKEEYTKEENKSKESNTEKLNEKINRKIAIELLMKKNKYEMKNLEKMRRDTVLEIMKKQKETETDVKTLYDLICKNGDNGACRNVLKSHHEQGITFGNVSHSRAMR